MLHWTRAAWHVVQTPDPTHNFAGSVATIGDQAWAVGRGSKGALTMHWTSASRRWVVVQNPAPTGSTLSDVTIAAADDVWATGTTRAGPLALRWNGKAWKSIPGPNFGQGSYASVTRIPGTQDVWIWGNDDASEGLAAARWHEAPSASWEKVALPVRAGGWTTTPRSIASASSSSAWIALTVDDGAGTNRPLTLSWNGSWLPVPITNTPGNASLTGISASAGGDVWAVGSSIARTPKGRTRQSFVLRWTGTSWSNSGAPRHSALIRPGVALGLGSVSPTPGGGPVWAAGVSLDEYHC